jgi:hypothetical protein
MRRCRQRFPRPHPARRHSTGRARRRGRGCLRATPCHRGNGIAGRCLFGLHVERSLELPDLFGSCQAHANPPHLGSFERTPNQGSFPPPALPGFIGYMSPCDACRTRFPSKRLRECRRGSNRSPVPVIACAHVLRLLPRRAGRPSSVGASGRPQRHVALPFGPLHTDLPLAEIDVAPLQRHHFASPQSGVVGQSWRQPQTIV